MLSTCMTYFVLENTKMCFGQYNLSQWGPKQHWTLIFYCKKNFPVSKILIKLYKFGMIWGWINDGRILILGQIILLKKTTGQGIITLDSLDIKMFLMKLRLKNINSTDSSAHNTDTICNTKQRKRTYKAYKKYGMWNLLYVKHQKWLNSFSL